MNLVIVPNYVSEAINKEINGFLEKNPHLEDKREDIRQDMINAFDEHGVVARLNPGADPQEL